MTELATKRQKNNVCAKILRSFLSHPFLTSYYTNVDHDGGEYITNSNIYICPMKLLNKIYSFQLSAFYTIVLPTLNFF